MREMIKKTLEWFMFILYTLCCLYFCGILFIGAMMKQSEYDIIMLLIKNVILYILPIIAFIIDLIFYYKFYSFFKKGNKQLPKKNFFRAIAYFSLYLFSYFNFKIFGYLIELVIKKI